MPTYEYGCGGCEKVIEVEQRITDKPISTCPTCGNTAFKRLISRTSFALKGSGWFTTDYKRTTAPSEVPKSCPNTACESAQSCAASPVSPSVSKGE